MSDNLRTRIAAALYARAIERLGWNRSWDNLGAPSQQLWLDDADAVIRELDDMGIIHLSKVRHDECQPERNGVVTDSLRDRLTDLIYGTVSWRDVNVPVAEEVADAIIELLSDSYTDEGIDIWLRASNRNLNMRRPIDLIVEGQIDTVIDEAKWVAGGM